MESRKISSYIYPTMELDLNNPSFDQHDLFEFDEADVWNNSCHDQSTINLDAKKPLSSSRASSKKVSRKMMVSSDHSSQMAPASASLPVNIPDWSKILKEEYREHGKSDEDVDDGDDDDDDDDDDRDKRVPPHEVLARRRGASFSVHEGIGRTLKGRDLRRLRNAVWQKTGFED
ncbi:phospholipase D C-like [Durio zibethinus]|uniref:Phospholipase D C-like n=1 Tax=Durio zibethinus TaxID=66656 RepID=A0A6P5Z2U0_DURZI|nr:phospholipase D C-like [Durio zibethinus]